MHKWLIALTLIPLAACTTGEDMALLHREITDVQRQVQSLQSTTLDKSDLTPMEKRLEDQTNKMMRSNADLAVKVDNLQEEIEALRANLEVTTRQLETISQDLSAAHLGSPPTATLPPVTTAPEGSQAPAAGGQQQQGETGTGTEATPAPSATPSPQTASPEDLYRNAYQDYMRGNYDLAEQGFSEYLRRFPNTDLSDNAQYWIGECYDAQDQPEKALKAFSEVLDKYPNSDKAAAAQLKKGLVYLKTGDQGQGVVNLQYVVYEHPGTKEADLARQKLRSLGITIR